MPDTDSKVAIAVAVIGVAGTVAAAVIGNWDKIFPPPAAPKSDQKDASPQPDSRPDISGLWQDVGSPANTTRVSQRGERFDFSRRGILPNGVSFESSGTGEVRGQAITSNYRTNYQNGLTSTGQCFGQVSSVGLLSISCADSILNAFSVSAVRQ